MSLIDQTTQTRAQQKKWFLFRHGLATHALSYGDTILTADLLPEGLPAVEKLAEFLADKPSDVMFCSPLARCQHTAEIVVKKKGLSFITDDRLREYYDESQAQFQLRVADFLTEVVKEDYQSIFVCTHGAVISSLKHLILNDNSDRFDEMDFPPPASLYKIDHGQFSKHVFTSLPQPE